MKLISWLPLKFYLFFLRTVFISSVVVWLLFFFIFQSVNQSLKWCLLFSSVLLHQIICACTIPYLHTITDLVWLACNISGLVFYAWFEQISWEINPWASQLVLIHAVLSYYLVGALSLLVLIRLAFVFDSGFRTLVQRFDLLVHLQPEWKQNLGAVRVLFGNSIWRSHFAGETKKLIVTRGSFAVVFLTSIIVFSLVKILTEPIRELRLIPTQNIRTPNGHTPVQNSISDAATWGIVLGRVIDPDLEIFTPYNFAHFHSAVSVTPLWYKDEPSNPGCVYLEGEQRYDEDVQLITYYCPPLIPIENASSGDDIIPLPYQYFRPDLLVTINFTTLGLSADNIRDVPTNSIQVMVAMSNRTDDIALMTTSTTLIPGINLMGRIAMEIHQTFKSPSLSFLGLFETVQSTVIAQMFHVFPDPQAGISPLIVHSPEIATIRVVSQSDASQWVIIQDFKDRTFLNGLSQTGGLWTFLSGIFAAVFGSSLMRILFGIKPVSVFGFAHNWEKKKIQTAYREEYPAIVEEINAPRYQRGLLSLLRDHIIDLNLMEETKEDFSAILNPKDVELDNFERGPDEAKKDQATTDAQ